MLGLRKWLASTYTGAGAGAFPLGQAHTESLQATLGGYAGSVTLMQQAKGATYGLAPALPQPCRPHWERTLAQQGWRSTRSMCESSL